MDEAPLVSGIEACSGLSNEGDCPAWFKRFLGLQEFFQVGAFDVPHGDEQLTGGFPSLIDRNHVRVVDRGGQPPLRAEPLLEGFVARELVTHQLERHLSSEREVLGPKDGAHPSPTDQLFDPVASELRTDAGIRGRGRPISVRVRVG